MNPKADPGDFSAVYDPESVEVPSYLKLWGTRGSVPVSGPEYTTFGGSTCCLEIHRDSRVIIVDAGTGIRGLGDQLLDSSIREIHLLFGHMHWDHIIGFPFFLPLYNPEFTVHLYAIQEQGPTMREALEHVLRPGYFPIRLDEMKAAMHYHTIFCGETIHIGDVHIDTAPCDHPGGSLAFKFTTAGRCIGYVTDNEFLKGYRGSPLDITKDHPLTTAYLPLIEFLSETDPLIHEAQYTPREYCSKIGWGHSSIANATTLVRLCNIRDWYVTHHDPSATDIILRRRNQLHWQIANECNLDCHIHLAFDGLTLPL